MVPAQRVALLHSCVSSPAQTGTLFGTHPRHPCMCLFVRMGALCPSMRMRLPPLHNLVDSLPYIISPAGRLASGENNKRFDVDKMCGLYVLAEAEC